MNRHFIVRTQVNVAQIALKGANGHAIIIPNADAFTNFDRIYRCDDEIAVLAHPNRVALDAIEYIGVKNLAAARTTDMLRANVRHESFDFIIVHGVIAP